MVLFDANFLSVLLRPGVDIPNDPRTGEPVASAKTRIEFLVKTLSAANEKIIIPTPALSEFLVLVSDKASDYLTAMNKSSVFRIAGFDERAAVEVAASIAKAKESGDKKSGSKSDWPKIKYDRQIVAIAKVEGVANIYSTDKDVANLGNLAGLTVVHIADLPLPPPKTPALPLEDKYGNPIDLP